ncbi:unnamed protein product, partial [Heterosigma akashiwo]
SCRDSVLRAPNAARTLALPPTPRAESPNLDSELKKAQPDLAQPGPSAAAHHETHAILPPYGPPDWTPDTQSTQKAQSDLAQPGPSAAAHHETHGTSGASNFIKPKKPNHDNMAIISPSA